AASHGQQLFAVDADGGRSQIAANGCDGDVAAEIGRFDSIAGEIADITGGRELRDGNVNRPSTGDDDAAVGDIGDAVEVDLEIAAGAERAGIADPGREIAAARLHRTRCGRR